MVNLEENYIELKYISGMEVCYPQTLSKITSKWYTLARRKMKSNARTNSEEKGVHLSIEYRKIVSHSH